MKRPFVNKALAVLARAVCGEARVIMDRAGKSPYLSRYYLIGKPRMADGSSPFDGGQLKKDAIHVGGIGVFVHRFHRSDDDVALHNHPWRWAISLILAGGYREERRTINGTSVEISDAIGEIEVNSYEPGNINVLTSETFHRVDLYEEEAWSLFVTGPKFSSWGFWDRATGEFVPWRAFIARLRGDGWDAPTEARS
jgi:hypothetical protein